MLMDHTPTEIGTASSLAPRERPQNREQEPDALFQLVRRHVESARVTASSAPAPVMATHTRKKPVAGGTTTAAGAAGKAETRSAAGPYTSTQEDTYGEAEAMAADEQRHSPPSPSPGRSLGYHHRRVGRRQAPSPRQSSVGETNTPERSSAGLSSFGSRVQQHGSSSHGGRSSSPTAPAYEPSFQLNNCSSSTVDAPWKFKPEGTQQRQQQRHDQTPAFGKGENLQQVEANDFSSVRNATKLSTSAEIHLEDAEINLQAEVKDVRLHQQRWGQAPGLLSLRGGEPPSSKDDRKAFLSTMQKSGDAYQNARQDLQQYMEGVRAR